MTFTRPISANEHLYLAGKRHFSDIVIQVAIEGTGHIDITDLQSSLTQVSRQFPGTCLRRVKKQWVADSQPPPVILLNEYPNLNQKLNHLIDIHNRFNPEKGYTCEVVLAQQNNRCLLIFRALHAVMDGQGMEMWMKAVFQAVRGEEILQAKSTLSDDDCIKLSKSTRSNEPFFPTSTGPTINHATYDDCNFEYARYTLDSAIPGIVAKLSIGIQQLLIQKKNLIQEKNQTGCIMIPVDLRHTTVFKEITKNTSLSTANLSLPLFVPLIKEQSWNQFSTQMLNQLQDHQFICRSRNDWLYHKLPSIALSWLVKRLWYYQIKKGKYFVSGVVSHTGRHHLENYSTVDFQATSVISIPCVMPIAPLSLVVRENVTKSNQINTEICLVKGKSLWGTPQALLDQLIQLSGLKPHKVNSSQITTKVTDAKPSLSAESINYPYVHLPDAHLGLHQLFERQVVQQPNAICLIFGKKSISYAEVNKRSNQLARLITAIGLQKGTLVGVGLERSFELIIAIIAIMKAGGVYLPLDPSMPSQRLQYMVKDSKVQWIISLTTHATTFRSVPQLTLLDQVTVDIAHFEDDNLNLPVLPHDLCYIIYTSGSTGYPKGAMNKHSALTNHFLWMQQHYGLGENDTTLQKTPISFDASLLEIFLPLQCGARIVITKPKGHEDAQYLLQEINNNNVTFLSIVPSVLNILLDEISDSPSPHLSLLLVGGEEFSITLYQKLKQYFPKASVYNLYGPAEAAIDVMAFNCSDKFSGNSIPIGKAIANIETYVVNNNMQLVKPGETGELIIAGVGLGPGYLNRPTLTAEKFIAHPFSPHSDKKAYRTGDLVKQLADGNIIFVGRVDHQVKIFGVRIELGEIEHQLQAISWINQAIVVTKDKTVNEMTGQKLLVAYYTIYSNHSNSSLDHKREIQLTLNRKLPGYMVPAMLIQREKMPLSPNGKIDRQALANADLSNIQATDKLAHRSDTEKQLAEIWQSLFNTSITQTSDFFELGGNSILAMSLIKTINNTFQLNLHTQCLFENPGFSNLAHLILQYRK